MADRTGINNKNSTINCCVIVVGVPFSSVELGEKLVEAKQVAVTGKEQ